MPELRGYTTRKGCGLDEKIYESVHPSNSEDTQWRWGAIWSLPAGALILGLTHLWVQDKPHIQDIFVNNALVAWFCMGIEVYLWFRKVSPDHRKMLNKMQRAFLAYPLGPKDRRQNGDKHKFMYQHPDMYRVEGESGELLEAADSTDEPVVEAVRDTLAPFHLAVLFGESVAGAVIFLSVLIAIVFSQWLYDAIKHSALRPPQIGMSLTTAALSASVWTTCQLVAHQLMFSQTYKGLIDKVAKRLTSVQYAAYCSGILTVDQVDAAQATFEPLTGLKCPNVNLNSVTRAVGDEASTSACQTVATEHMENAGQGVLARFNQFEAEAKALATPGGVANSAIQAGTGQLANAVGVDDVSAVRMMLPNDAGALADLMSSS